MHGSKRAVLILGMLFILLWSTLILLLVFIEKVILVYVKLSLLRSALGLLLAGLWVYSCYKFSRWIFHRFLNVIHSSH